MANGRYFDLSRRNLVWWYTLTL